MKTTCLVAVSVGMLFASSSANAQVKGFVSVSEDMLRDPPPGDWLNWRRTDDAWGYSPLDQITVDNVDQLQLAWSWAMDDTGGQEAAPLVHDGIIYLPNPRGVIQALDGATGDLIWENRPGVTLRVDGTTTVDNSGLPAGTYAGVGRGVQKNIAIWGDMIYAATGNASIVAVDARRRRFRTRRNMPPASSRTASARGNALEGPCPPCADAVMSDRQRTIRFVRAPGASRRPVA